MSLGAAGAEAVGAVDEEPDMLRICMGMKCARQSWGFGYHVDVGRTDAR